MVNKLLDAGADPNRAQLSGLTPLMTAATGNLDIVKALLAKGATVNAATEDANATALMWALSGNHGEIARTLIAAGAMLRSTSKGFTPLMFAARSGDVEKALAAAGADVNALGADGTHVLAYTVRGRKPSRCSSSRAAPIPTPGSKACPTLHAAGRLAHG